MIIKVVQSLVSVVCQSAYLFMNVDLTDPTVKVTTKILFIANIGFSFANLVMSLILLVMKQELLATVQEEEDKTELEEKQEKAAGADPADLAVIINPLMNAKNATDGNQNDVEAGVIVSGGNLRDFRIDKEDDAVTAQMQKMGQEAARLTASDSSDASDNRRGMPSFVTNLATSEALSTLKNETKKQKKELKAKDREIEEYKKRVKALEAKTKSSSAKDFNDDSSGSV